MAKYKISLNGQGMEIEVLNRGDYFDVIYGGTTTTLHLLHRDGSAFVLEQEQPDGTRRDIHFAGHLAENDRRQLWVNGHTFTYQRIRERGGGADAADDSSLSASIPAVVSQVLVSEGDVVVAGDKLVLLESMKMVIPIQAPYNGTVTRVNCSAGDSIQPGVLLVEVEPREDSRQHMSTTNDEGADL